MDDDYVQAKKNENLQNPKNRCLGLFCHANEVDNRWGCDWSFATGVVIFSIICGAASLWDIYYIAKDKFFDKAAGHAIYKLFFFFKIFSDLVCFAGIGIACFSINRNSHTYSIVSYYVMVLSFLLHTLYLIYTIFAIFDADYFNIVKFYLISWGIDEVGLLLFCWILFCNQVFIGRQIRIANQNNPV